MSCHSCLGLKRELGNKLLSLFKGLRLVLGNAPWSLMMTLCDSSSSSSRRMTDGKHDLRSKGLIRKARN